MVAASLALLTGLLVAEPVPGLEQADAFGGPMRTALLADGTRNYDPVVDYALEARLDPETHTVTAKGRVRWRNTGTVPVRALWWHLYLNAFRNTRSTFIQESGGKLRGDERTEDSWGWIEVTELRTTGTATRGVAQDILPTATFEAPDDGNPEDRTVLRTPLPFAVAPGEEVEVELAFTSRLPKVYARSGYHGTFHMVAQWFPKIGVLQETFRPGPDGGAVLDADGEPVWNCHQYHAHSEFFADYGRFRMALTVPKDYVVGASGKRVGTQDNGDGTVTHEHFQDRVHDFAWAADRRFETVTRTFTDAEVTDAERAEVGELLDLPPDDLQLGDVQVTLLVQPEHRAYAERYLRAVFESLKWFGLWYGAYPYETLTVIDGPRGAGGAMGMEYPTLITGGVSWPAPEGEPRPEAVTVHEFGHQYWYGLVGSNEFEESWLDEGFNTYSTGRVLDRAWGRWRRAPRVLGVSLFPWFRNQSFDQTEGFRVSTMRAPDRDAVLRNSWSYRDSTAYGVNSYPRPALVLRQLEELLGPKLMARGMRLYHLRYRYRHPTTEAFRETMEEISARDLGSFFDRTIYSAGRVDYGIARLDSDRPKTGAGVFDAPEAKPGTIAHRTVPTADAKAADEAAEEAEHGAPYETEVLVMRYGEVPFGVALEVTFTDGSTRAAVWDGRYRWHKVRFETEARAVSARLYPHAPLLLDANPTNDARLRKGSAKAGRTWGAHALYIVQSLLEIIGGLL